MILLLLGLFSALTEAAEPVSGAIIQTEEPAQAADASEEALEQLEQLGQQLRQSTATTLALVASTNTPPELRRRAVLALATAGIDSPEQARLLFAILTNPAEDAALRRAILMAFSEQERFSALLLPALLQVVRNKQNEAALRQEALHVLRRFARESSVAPMLIEVFAETGDDTDVRLAVLDHLRMFAPETITAFGPLSQVLQNRHEPLSLRTRALDTLRAMGERARPVSTVLVALVANRDEALEVRLNAVQSLRQIGWTHSETMQLAQVLFHSETPAALRGTLAELTGMMEPPPAMLVTQWLPVLTDPGAPLPARRLAARMLATADLGLPDGIELSAHLFHDRDEDLQIRIYAGEFLRRSGVGAAPARETLERILLSADAPRELRELASTALAQVAQVWLERPDQLDRVTLNRRLAATEHLVDVMQQAAIPAPPHPQNLETVTRMRDVLLAEKNSRWLSRWGDWAEAHPVTAAWTSTFLGLILMGVALTIAWWILSWTAPVRLSQIDARLRCCDLISQRGNRPAFGLRHLVLLAPWARHERVLDAWAGLLGVRTKAMLQDRSGPGSDSRYLDLSVKVDGAEHDTCPFDALLLSLSQPGTCVAIVGEAGAGKTTLAWQLLLRAYARFSGQAQPVPPLLPVWVEAPGDAAPVQLLKSLLDQSGITPNDPTGPSVEMLERLMASGRVVPVLDGYSEWNHAEREHVWQTLSGMEPLSMVITGRERPRLSDRQSTEVLTLRLAGPGLVRCIGGLLPAHDPGETDVLQACEEWTELTMGRAMPIDAVSVYAEYLHMEHDRPSGISRPGNVLELVRRYVELLNRAIQHEPLRTDLILKAAGELAWLCARQGGSAHPGQFPESIPPPITEYLTTKLTLLRKLPGTDRLCFIRQSVADYLAAAFVIEKNGSDDRAWRELEKQLKHGMPWALRRLTEALWNACHQAADPFASPPIPEWLYEALSKQLDTPDATASQPNPRIRQWTRLVLTPENPERSAAIESLAALGAEAAPALPTLLGAFQKPGEDLEVRHAVLTLFGLMGAHAMAVLPGLRRAVQDRKEHLFLRLKALEIVMALDAGSEETRQLLVDKGHDSAESGIMRERALEALARIDAAANNPAAAVGSGQAPTPA